MASCFHLARRLALGGSNGKSPDFSSRHMRWGDVEGGIADFTVWAHVVAETIFSLLSWALLKCTRTKTIKWAQSQQIAVREHGREELRSCNSVWMNVLVDSDAIVRLETLTNSWECLCQMKVKIYVLDQSASVALHSDMLHLNQQEVCQNNNEGGRYLRCDTVWYRGMSTAFACRTLLL